MGFQFLFPRFVTCLISFCLENESFRLETMLIFSLRFFTFKKSCSLCFAFFNRWESFYCSHKCCLLQTDYFSFELFYQLRSYIFAKNFICVEGIWDWTRFLFFNIFYKLFSLFSFELFGLPDSFCLKLAKSEKYWKMHKASNDLQVYPSI